MCAVRQATTQNKHEVLAAGCTPLHLWRQSHVLPAVLSCPYYCETRRRRQVRLNNKAPWFVCTRCAAMEATQTIS